MNAIHFLIFLLVVAGLSACDCAISAEGHVYDSATGQPLVGATVQLLETSETDQTGTDGFFDLYFASGFCPDVVLRVSTPGYKPFELEIDGDGKQSIYRVRRETYDVALDPPFTPNPAQPDSYLVQTSFNRFSQGFAVSNSGAMTFYLDPDDPAAELEEWKESMSEGFTSSR